MLHQKRPLDSRQIPRPIHKKICPLLALSECSNSIIRYVRLLRYRDARVAPVFPSVHTIASLRVHSSSSVGCRSNSSITKCVHQLLILESAQQLQCGVPQQVQHHQAQSSAAHPQDYMTALMWGAAATPASPRTYISSPSTCVSSGVRRHSCSIITKHTHNSPSAHVNSGVGCRSNSVITKACIQLRPNIWGSENIPAIGYKP